MKYLKKSIHKLMFVFTLSAFILLLINHQEIKAQINEGETLDKIVAIVGDQIIMLSDIQGELEKAQQSDPKININDPVLYKRILDGLIDEKLVVSKAIEDSVEVTDDEIDQRWSYLLKNFVQRVGSEKRIEDIYGMSINKLKLEYKEGIKNQILYEKMWQKKFGTVKSTARETEEFYKSYKDSIPTIQEQYELYHLVRNIEAKIKTKEEVFNLAKRVRDSIVNGGKFGDFAARYSSDAQTASAGGELGWVNKGLFFPEFEKAAFELQPGQLSQPIETPFGYHIIETIDKQKEKILVRHILFKIGQSSEDQKFVIEFLNGLKSRVEKGESFEEIAKMFSDDKDTKAFGGLIGKIATNQIPAEIKEIVDKLKDGEISAPTAYNSDPLKPAMHIIYKKRTIPEHKANLDTDYKGIDIMATSFKQNKLYTNWVAKLRSEMYWEIKK